MIPSLLAIGALQAAAAAAPEWVAAAGDNTEAAVLIYGGDLSLSVLCRDNRLDFLVGGLPPTTENIRTVQVNVPTDPLRNSTWIVGADGTTLISTAPAIYARRLRQTDRLTLRMPSENGQPARRYEFALPADHVALDHVLESCDTPLDRPADLEFVPELPLIRWSPQPMPSYPREGMDVVSATVLMECMVQTDGRVDDCEILTEEPRRRGFGREALKAVRRARIVQIGSSPIREPRTARFTIRFRLG